MFNQIKSNKLAIVFGDNRQSKKVNNQSTPGKFSSPCGSADSISHQVGGCMGPIFDIVEGKFEGVRGDQDLVEKCDRFTSAEKCVRQISKDCLSGLHKTSVGSVSIF